MLAELTQALDRVPADAPTRTYTAAIVDENVLGKPTRSTRQRTAKSLAELYALDPGCPLFRSVRFYWSGGNRGAADAGIPPRLRTGTRSFGSAPRKSLASRGIRSSHRPRSRRGSGRSIRAASAHDPHSTAQNLASTWAQAGILRAPRETTVAASWSRQSLRHTPSCSATSAASVAGGSSTPPGRVSWTGPTLRSPTRPPRHRNRGGSGIRWRGRWSR